MWHILFGTNILNARSITTNVPSIGQPSLFIFDKIKRIASEQSELQLIKWKCLSILLYGPLKKLILIFRLCRRPSLHEII